MLGAKNNYGFTLVEVMIVMAIFTILAALVVVNLTRPQLQASLDSALGTLLADIKAQQLKAMVGNSEGAGSAQQYGLFFASSSYTLWHGTSYSSTSTNNFVVPLGGDIALANVTWPTSTLLFARRSGEVVNFVNGQNSLIVQVPGGQQQTITVNRYGVLTLN